RATRPGRPTASCWAGFWPAATPPRSRPSSSGTGRWCWASAAACSATGPTPRTPSRPRYWCWCGGARAGGRAARAAARPPGARDLVGNWLYGVAYRTALEARTSRTRRRVKEAQVSPMTAAQDVPDEAAGRELRRLVDRELSRLPDKYRAAVVLCDLEGKTRRE